MAGGMSDTPAAEDTPLRVDRLQLVGITGANKVMAGELSRLVRRAYDDIRLPEPVKEGQGAVSYPFDLRTAAVAVMHHRTASRVYWNLYRSRAERLEPLYDDLCAAIAAEDRPWLRDGLSFSVNPASTLEFAAGARQLVGVLKNALIDTAAKRGLTLRVDPDAPDLVFAIKVFEGVVTVSLDLGGQAMNQRGYRSEGGGVAPLRESVAAMLVMLARHDARTEAFLDPMAGSGTLAIEAACMARGRPLWVGGRRPAAVRLPGFAPLCAALDRPLFGDTRPIVFANELDRATFGQAEGNYRRAGVDAEVERKCGDFRDIDPDALRRRVAARGGNPDRGLILCNPPYGERLAPDELNGLYRELGTLWRHLPGWRAGFIVANPEFELAFGQLARVKKPVSNAQLPAYFLLFD
jgi:23S rRNA G2445 N2-methylase RlmL